MRKLLQTLWLPLIFSLLLPLNLQAQNGWVAYSIPSPGGDPFHFGNSNNGIVTGKFNYYRTTTGGVTWSSYPVPNPGQNIDYLSVFFINENTGWLGMLYQSFPLAGGDLYKTTNGGLNWINASGFSSGVQDIQFVNATTGFMALGSSPMFHTEGYIAKSTNGGFNWTTIGSAGYTIDINFLNENTGWGIGYVADDIGLYISLMERTTNGGSSWSTLIRDSVPAAPYDPLRKVQFTNSNTGYLLRTKLFKSTNAGDNWLLLDTNVFSGRYMRSFYFINKDTGWAAATNAMFYTTNGGVNWSMQNIPLNVTGSIYFINPSTGWALANNTTILKTTTGGITSINNLSSEVPESFRLHQNYPNPFNPETKIKFEIPRQGFVSLKIYDMAGKEVSALFNGELAPGVYEYSFSAIGVGVGLGSGVYFYKLQSGEFVETRRMVLVK